MSDLAAVVLAAGKGMRMGRAKALLELDGRTLLEVISERLLDVGCHPVAIVINREVRAEIENRRHISFDRIESVKLVVNAELEKGALHSVRLGLQSFSVPGKGVFLFPVDHPFVRNETLSTLARQAASDRVLIPTYRPPGASSAGVRGHPPVFGSDLLPLLCSIPLSEGARGVYRRMPGIIHEIEVDDPGVLLNINTPDDWQKGLQLLDSRKQINQNAV